MIFPARTTDYVHADSRFSSPPAANRAQSRTRVTLSSSGGVFFRLRRARRSIRNDQQTGPSPFLYVIIVHTTLPPPSSAVPDGGRTMFVFFFSFTSSSPGGGSAGPGYPRPWKLKESRLKCIVTAVKLLSYQGKVGLKRVLRGCRESKL